MVATFRIELPEMASDIWVLHSKGHGGIRSDYMYIDWESEEFQVPGEIVKVDKHYAIWRSQTKTVLVVRIFRELRPDATNFKLDTAIVFLAAACRIVLCLVSERIAMDLQSNICTSNLLFHSFQMLPMVLGGSLFYRCWGLWSFRSWRATDIARTQLAEGGNGLPDVFLGSILTYTRQTPDPILQSLVR
jgi:hypothetical protein